MMWFPIVLGIVFFPLILAIAAFICWLLVTMWTTFFRCLAESMDSIL